MECYEGAKMIKTFRGLIADANQDTIILHTNDGSMGYRIVKLEVIGSEPVGADAEYVIKIYKVEQPMPLVDSDVVDFSDNTLLAAGVWSNRDAPAKYYQATIFDQEIFNQDIYVTVDASAGSLNYYIELEQVKLDLNESSVATLKDIRNKELRTMTA